MRLVILLDGVNAPSASRRKQVDILQEFKTKCGSKTRIVVPRKLENFSSGHPDDIEWRRRRKEEGRALESDWSRISVNIERKGPQNAKDTSVETESTIRLRHKKVYKKLRMREIGISSWSVNH
jgi:hypothetical protein